MARNRNNTQSEDPPSKPDVITTGDQPTGRVITAGAGDLARVKSDRGLSNRQISEDLGGVSAGLVSQWLNGSKRAYGVYRDRMREKYGIDPTGWDRVAGSAPATSEQQSGDSPAPEVDDETALEIARSNLTKVRQELEQEGMVAQDKARLLALEASAARVIGQLTGELDQTDLQKFRSSIEYRSLVRRLVGALTPFPDAREAVLRVLGHQVDSGVIATTGPLDLARFAEVCGYVEDFKAIDDLAEGADQLVYPIAGRERELVVLSRDLASRVVAALERADPVILASKIAYPPADEYRARVIDRLRAEVLRGELVARFEVDFGALAVARAAEAFG